MEINHYQNPKTAIIRILKSQGCCPSQNNHQTNPQLQQMIGYRQELSIKATQQRSKLSQIPCAVTLAEQVQQLRQVVNGLTRENKGRVEHLMKIKQKAQLNISWQANDSSQQHQHQRLQQQHQSLQMKQIEDWYNVWQDGDYKTFYIDRSFLIFIYISTNHYVLQYTETLTLYYICFFIPPVCSCILFSFVFNKGKNPLKFFVLLILMLIALFLEVFDYFHQVDRDEEYSKYQLYLQYLRYPMSFYVIGYTNVGWNVFLIIKVINMIYLVQSRSADCYRYSYCCKVESKRYKNELIQNSGCCAKFSIFYKLIG